MKTQWQDAPAVVVGALNLDVCGMPEAALLAGDSAPGQVTLGAGGVGHNIARALARSGVPVELVTLLGDDDAAALLARHCAAEGIGLRHAARRPGPSCAYLCVQDERGDLALGINAMRQLDHLTPALLRGSLDALRAAPLVCADANLSAQTLEALLDATPAPVLLDPVSGPKAVRARHLLGRLAAIKPNLLEARALTGEEVPEAAAKALLGMGVARVFISLGGEGVLFADAGGMGRLPAPRMRVRSTSGAGDTMAAGIALGMLRGGDTRACAQTGVTLVTQFLLDQGGALL